MTSAFWPAAARTGKPARSQQDRSLGNNGARLVAFRGGANGDMKNHGFWGLKMGVCLWSLATSYRYGALGDAWPATRARRERARQGGAWQHWPKERGSVRVRALPAQDVEALSLLEAASERAVHQR